eukprot:746250-Hanusia_phi.AAC.2
MSQGDALGASARCGGVWTDGDLERERRLKAQMSVRVKKFYDVNGRRPSPDDIQRSASWWEMYKEIGALRTKRKQASSDELHPLAQETLGKKQKVEERIEIVTLPDPLPSPPEGFKEKKDKEGRLPVAAALYLCFSDKFATLTSAKRAARRGGDPRVFRVDSADVMAQGGDEKRADEEDHGSGQQIAMQRSGSALICKDHVSAGERLMFVYKPPKPPKVPSKVQPPGFSGGKHQGTLKVLLEVAGACESSTPLTCECLQDEHLAVVVKPPSLLSHWQPGCSGDVKSLLSASLASVSTNSCGESDVGAEEGVSGSGGESRRGGIDRHRAAVRLEGEVYAL